MKQLGMRKSLIISVMLLVGISVSVSSYILYSNGKKSVYSEIMEKSKSYTDSKANYIQLLLGEKIGGLKKLSSRYLKEGLSGNDDELIEKTKFLANAMNLDSAVIAFENGSAYWNQSGPGWPNNKLNGDVKEKGWYQAGRRADNTIITDPYLYDGKYWVTMVDKIKDGCINVEYELSFLNEIVSQITSIPGSSAIILNQDTTVLASSSDAIIAGEKATDYGWFSHVAQSIVDKKDTIIDYTTTNGDEKLLFSKQISIADKHWYFAVILDKSVTFRSIHNEKNNAIFIAFIATLISIVIAYGLIQQLNKPIIKLRDMIQGLSRGDGDLTQRLAVTSNDEIGQIATGVNHFIENLQNIMLEIQLATNNLSQNTNRLKEQSATNSHMLQNHLSETEQVVTAIEEMNSTASAMAQDVAHTASLTQQADDHSQASRQVVTQSQQTFSALIADVEKSTVDAEKMTEKTQGINNVLSVIGGIAEQTNLLALNAAIEAARAGEQGRGFAVVADEVRNLASRTKDSTEEIEVALTELLSGNQAVVQSMNQTKERCLTSAENAVQVTQSLEAMANFVNDINKLNTQIATAAEEQSSVTHELSQNMASINDIVVELDGNGQKALQEADDIGKVNDQLVAIVSRFKL
jgi:methyl-accepting chemotaxis protein